MRARRFGGLALVAMCAVACGGSPSTPPKAVDAATGEPRTSEAADPLGPRPGLGEPVTFHPPVPVRYQRPGGLDVWLLERHALPIVSVQIVVPAGAAQDPEGKSGLAVTTANMLDEGAGARGALELSRDVDRLGATIRTGAVADYGFAQLTVLKKNLAPAGEIFGDIVSKPRFSAVEFKRVHDLWRNALRARQSDPESVASVVVARKVYPKDHPYAHPHDGTLASSANVTLNDVKSFYAAHWRPDRATCVVVGDITRAELDDWLDRVLAGWKAPPSRTPSAPSGPPAPMVGHGEPPPGARRVFVVDRPEAPQSVIAVARQGVSAFDEESAPLFRVNAALGGSFTSRLNQTLREEHGWSYGARSRFAFTRLRGLFVAQAAVQTEHTGDALAAMLEEIGALAKSGLTEEEVEKTKELARADLVEAFETIRATTARLGRNAGLGLKPDHEISASGLTTRADKEQLKRLSTQYLDLTGGTIVIVGPKAKIVPQLTAIGIRTIESSDPEGQ